MKKASSSLWVLAFAAMSSSAWAVTADQKISAVTVYPDRALVTRSGEVKLDAGVQTVVFENLPLGLEEDSVRAKASSAGGLKILGVEVRRDYKEAAVSAGTKQLQDDITKIDDQERTLKDEGEDNRRRQEFLDQMKAKVTTPAKSESGEGKDPTASVQTMQGFFALYGTETSKISTRWREIQFELRDLDKTRADKANQLSLLQQPAAPNTRSAIVTVEAAEPGSASLQVTYLMSGAGWQPQYDAYADPATQKVELTYLRRGAPDHGRGLERRGADAFLRAAQHGGATAGAGDVDRRFQRHAQPGTRWPHARFSAEQGMVERDGATLGVGHEFSGGSGHR